MHIRNPLGGIAKITEAELLGNPGPLSIRVTYKAGVIPIKLRSPIKLGKDIILSYMALKIKVETIRNNKGL